VHQLHLHVEPLKFWDESNLWYERSGRWAYWEGWEEGGGAVPCRGG
jgi:hypothetical protein